MTLGPGEEATTSDEWVVLWFPPEGDRERRFTDEAKARKLARNPDIAEWNPLLEHRITTTLVVAELVPLE